MKVKKLFYMEKYTSKSDSEEEEIIKDVVFSILNYHYNYGKDAFLSERTYEFSLGKRIDEEIKYRIEENIDYYIRSVNVVVNNHEEVTKEIESRNTFYKWM